MVDVEIADGVGTAGIDLDQRTVIGPHIGTSQGSIFPGFGNDVAVEIIVIDRRLVGGDLAEQECNFAGTQALRVIGVGVESSWVPPFPTNLA